MPRVQWSPVDLLDPAAVASIAGGCAPSAIYHCAGVADVHGSWKSPTHALRINALGTHHLLDAAQRARPLVPDSRHRLRARLSAVLEPLTRRRIR